MTEASEKESKDSQYGKSGVVESTGSDAIGDLVDPSSMTEVNDVDGSEKRKLDDGEDGEDAKKPKVDDDGEDKDEGDIKDDDSGPPPVPASKEGTSIFADNDVLSGRGGGTNVHPGNRNFRDLINLHRRAYLKARKNDKPAISRAIVRSIRESNGRFLKKDEKTGLWFEIGDDAAREKTSQALRQRAPEMRKLLFDTEREEARVAAHEHMRHQQRMIMGMPPEMMAGGGGGGNAQGSSTGGSAAPPGMQMPPGGMFPNPAFFAMAGKNMMPGMPPGATPEAYQQMFNAAFMGGGAGMNKFSPPPASSTNGAS